MQPSDSLKILKNKIRPRWMKTARQLIKSRLKLTKVTKKLNLNPVNSSFWVDKKSSDKLFILGSGASISTINENEWNLISSSDTFGFNFWMLHDLVPTYYATEIYNPSKEDEEAYRAFMKLLFHREERYKDVPILIKDGERVSSARIFEYVKSFPEKLRRNIVLSWDWEFPDNELAGLANVLKRWDKWGLFTSTWAPYVRKRASIFYLVAWALRAGYKEIILLGVDLNNSDYFYYQTQVDFPVPPRDRSMLHNNAIHKTENKVYGEVTISEALQLLNKEVLEPHNIKLSVGFMSSSLYPMLPSYFQR